MLAPSGDLQPCVGLGLGTFFAVSLFHAIQRIWLTETTYYRANFSAADKV